MIRQASRASQQGPKSLKVAVITEIFPLSSETFILNQITGLIDSGHEVDVFARKNGSSDLNQPDIKRYQLSGQVSYFEAQQKTGFGKMISLLGAAFQVALRNFNIFLLCLVKYRDFKRRFHLNIFHPAAAFIQKKDYDIIHCHYGSVGSLATYFKKIGVLKGAIVAAFYGKDIRDGQKEGEGSYRELAQEAAAVLSISNDNYTNLLSLGLSPEKIIHHPVGVDVRQFKIIRNMERESQTVYFLTVARLVEEKGWAHVLEVMVQFKRKNPKVNFKYLIIGDGPLREKIADQVRQYHLEEQVYLLGGLPQNKVIDHIAQADIFLYPGRDDAFPVAVIEAQLGGLPVIASQVGAMKEIIIDQESGFIVPPGDVAAMLMKMEALVNNSHAAKEMGAFGQRIVAKRFGSQELNIKLLQIYQEVLAERKKEPNVNIVSYIHNKIKREVRQFCQEVEVQRDVMRFQNKFDQFSTWEDQLEENYQLLSPYYEDYIQSYSDEDTAISLELGAFLLTFCQQVKPKMIADIGSGFSSFVFRYYAAQEGEVVTVYSIDDNLHWLEQTAQFLHQYNLSTDKLMTWDDFQGKIHPTFDLLLHDLGSMNLREKTLAYVLNLVEGFVFLDDMDQWDYTSKAKKLVRKSKGQMYSLGHYTKDRFNRFSSLGILDQKYL